MAGDWIKARKNLGDDPAVVEIARGLGVDRDLVVGKLLRFWSWIDDHTATGRIRGIDEAFIDSLVSCPTFARLLVEIGWLRFTKRGVSIPRFERHMSESAKQRALAAERQSRSRRDASNGRGVTKALPEKSVSPPTGLTRERTPAGTGARVRGAAPVPSCAVGRAEGERWQDDTRSYWWDHTGIWTQSKSGGGPKQLWKPGRA